MALPPPPALPAILPYLPFTHPLHSDQDSCHRQPSPTAFSAFHNQNRRTRSGTESKVLSELDKEELALQAKVAAQLFLCSNKRTWKLQFMDNSICGPSVCSRILHQGIMQSKTSRHQAILMRRLIRKRRLGSLARSWKRRTLKNTTKKKNSRRKKRLRKRRNKFVPLPYRIWSADLHLGFGCRHWTPFWSILFDHVT